MSLEKLSFFDTLHLFFQHKLPTILSKVTETRMWPRLRGWGFLRSFSETKNDAILIEHNLES